MIITVDLFDLLGFAFVVCCIGFILWGTRK